MQEDTLKYDSIAARPLPKWLTNQKEGLTTYKPREIIMKEDHSLYYSFAVTGLFVFIFVCIWTIFIRKLHKNKSV